MEGGEHPDRAAGQTAGVCGPEVVAAAALIALVRAGGWWRQWPVQGSDERGGRIRGSH